MKKKRDHFLEQIIDLCREMPKGRVLDLGCGDGNQSKRLSELGHQVTAVDEDIDRFKYTGEIEFIKGNVTRELPFGDAHFDCILLLEVIEHLPNPYAVMKQINRILKPDGCLIISTPNILSLKSRFRFLFEGAYEFFREPPWDQQNNPKEVIYNLHIVPYRYHELEYLLGMCGFRVEQIATSQYEGYVWLPLVPFIKLHYSLKERRARRRGGVDYSRMHRILLTRELLFGRHLILKTQKIDSLI